MTRSERIDRHLRDLVSRGLLEQAAILSDSPRVFRRMAMGERIMATVMHDQMQCEVEVQVGRHTFVSRCDCGSERRHCVHAVAVAMTYMIDEESFMDVDSFLDGLGAMKKRDLVAMLRALLGRGPRAMTYLGFPGFEEPWVEADEFPIQPAEAPADPFDDDDFITSWAGLQDALDDDPDNSRLN
jgi:hypothetical protein